MKKLENKITQIKKKTFFLDYLQKSFGFIVPMPEIEENEPLNYADLIKMVCNQPVQGGFSMTDINMRNAIIKSCEKADGFIEVEDLRVDYLKAITATSKWQTLYEDVETFAEDIKNCWVKE